MRRSRRSSNRDGQALVEFAVTVPILLLLVVGIIEVGRLMSAYQTITDTAREAARRVVVADGQSCEGKRTSSAGEDLAQMVRDRLSLAGLNPDEWENQEPTEFITCDNPNLGSTTVHLEYAYRMGWLGPMIGWTTGQETVLLRSTTRMRQE